VTNRSPFCSDRGCPGDIRVGTRQIPIRHLVARIARAIRRAAERVGATVDAANSKDSSRCGAMIGSAYVCCNPDGGLSQCQALDAPLAVAQSAYSHGFCTRMKLSRLALNQSFAAAIESTPGPKRNSKRLAICVRLVLTMASRPCINRLASPQALASGRRG
jgi:hypothetical protein